MAVPGNEDMRQTGSLFFLPDDRRVRARAEVKPELTETVINYELDFETDPQRWTGFYQISAVIYEVESGVENSRPLPQWYIIATSWTKSPRTDAFRDAEYYYLYSGISLVPFTFRTMDFTFNLSSIYTKYISYLKQTLPNKDCR